METHDFPVHTDRQFRISWIAYVLPLLGVATAATVSVAVSAHINFAIGSIVGLIGALPPGLGILTLRNTVFFTDEDGVWLYRGVFPWNRGVIGVKWRDLDDATYTANLWSWLFASYRIRIRHRFTKSNEFVVHHLAQGDQAAEYVNQRNLQMVRLHANQA